MVGYIEKKCPNCGQRLRIPEKIGGMLMACPACKKKFHTDFRISTSAKTPSGGIVLRAFEMPTTILQKIRKLLY